MQINLSSESVNVIINTLRDSKKSLKSQINKWERVNEPNKLKICQSQLRDVEDVLTIFEEEIYGR